MDPITGSILLAAALFGGGVSMYQGAKNRKEQKRMHNEQMALAKEQLYHGQSIAVNDLKAAGLHPSLAAGNPGHSSIPSTPHLDKPEFDPSPLIQGALVRSQIDLNNANAEKARASIPHDKTHANAAATQALSSLQSAATNFDKYRHFRDKEWEIEKAFKQAQTELTKKQVITEDQRKLLTEAEKVVKQFTVRSLDQTGMFPPTKDAATHELDKIFSNMESGGANHKLLMDWVRIITEILRAAIR